MKLSHCLTALLILSAGSHAWAQDQSKVTVPSSPAFSIVDYEPSAILRPTSTRALATDLLSSFDREGKLLPNVGIEVAPYWLGSHPNLRRNTYLNPGPGQTFLQTLSLSAATVRDSASGMNRLGAGFRFRLLNGNPRTAEIESASSDLRKKTDVLSAIGGLGRSVGGDIKTKKDALDALEINLNAIQITADTRAALLAQASQVAESFPESTQGITSMLSRIQEEIENSDIYKDLVQKKVKLLYDRRGLSFEVAGASSFITGKSTSFDKAGIWANLTYFVSADDLFTLSLRNQFRNRDSSINNLDVGLGFLKKATTFNISIEVLWRRYRAEFPGVNSMGQPIQRVDKDNTWRMAAQASYLISKDVSINLSLGKDFDSPFIGSSGFFSVFGINYSLFSKEPTSLK
ncbi:MAG: hypothetical protein EOP04_09255 [Proteobacteria bacterium]|nr:MAG: hypothetical protein EOP04_09255 [Pseudomonadota bacterium]